MNKYQYVAAIFAAVLTTDTVGYAQQAAAAGETTGQYMDDTVITTKVKTALIGDDLVKARNIKVETNKGTVTLSGEVYSVAERDRALEITRKTEGVKAVADNLMLKQ